MYITLEREIIEWNFLFFIVVGDQTLSNISPFFCGNLRGVCGYQRCNQMDTQHDGRKIKDKTTNNDLLNIIHKTKDGGTRTPLKIWGELMCSGRVGSSVL